ncbi:MAG: hypothetical protein J6N45_00490 [Alphaproteobacteria bacterium]|nr:hypothetical protein [Alphaproteobacteria bacterium]
MSNDVENCPAEEFIKLCFADDSGKNGHKFWENFAKLRVDVWEKDCPKIYNYKNSYDALPDPDVNSYNLYEAHIRVWNIQHKKFNIKDIKRNGRCRCEIITEDEQVILGSDSIMSIYWHRTYGNMPEIMKKISQTKSNYKEFIKEYLKKANTIGGFILFPRHANSINQRRGRKPFDDRFDLALECIRRSFMNESFSSYNPLFNISAEDKDFFRMFGEGKAGFEKYAEFFCLNGSWVENGKVLNLLYNDENKDKTGRNAKTLDEWDFSQEPLPNSAEWWTFYRNIMNRLDARNEQIKEVIEGK